MRLRSKIPALALSALAATGAVTTLASSPASASTFSSYCRAYTNPGTYPYGIQIQPCIYFEPGHPTAYGEVNVYSPQTDIHVYVQVGVYQNGTWTARAGNDHAAAGWFPVATPVTDVSTSIEPACVTTRAWFTESGRSYGYAESPCYENGP